MSVFCSSFQYQKKQKHSEERRDKEASSSDFSHCINGCVVLRSVFLSKLEKNKRYIVYLDHRLKTKLTLLFEETKNCFCNAFCKEVN